ncbi:MAG: alpha/beta hydrolase [Armatimonadetes bacterium]|nr:alpha/beta hydrolase [Armatimonadota bacterium]
MNTRHLAILSILWVLACSAARADDQLPFVGVWIDGTAALSDADVNAAMDALAARESDPQQIVVLIHGFATPRADSTKQYTVMGQRALDAFQKYQTRTVVLGIQWDSMPPAKNWLKQVIEATIGLSDNNPYLQKVQLAREVGRNGGRHVMSAVRKRFPNANVNVFAHSLGTDVTAHILAPNYAGDATLPEGDIYAPGEWMSLNVVAFAGADLDFNLLYRNKRAVQQLGHGKLFWLTQGEAAGLSVEDSVLFLRSIIRGRAALGDRYPVMHSRQIDVLCGTRRLVLDPKDIPADHDILKYYSAARINNLAQAAVAITNAAVRDPLLDELSKVIEAPNDVKMLSEFFKSAVMSVQYYAFWRVETIICGRAVHLGDGTIASVAVQLRDNPRAINAEYRWRCPCEVVRRGIWPTGWMIQRNLDALPGSAGGVPDETRM